MSAPKTQALDENEDKATRGQVDSLYYLAGLKTVDEKKLSLELFNVSFFDLTYSQAEQMLEHLRALPRKHFPHYHECITCYGQVECSLKGCTKELAEHVHCRHSMTRGEYERTYR